MPKKLTIEQMQELAHERGGKCLSKTYVNSKTKLEWECAEGHRWPAIPNSARQGQWCPKCLGNKRLTIEQMQEIAQSRGGKCLSTKYIHSKTKLEWQCAEEHRWWATPNRVKTDTWCPKCGRKIVGDKLRSTIKQMQNLARKRGGRCLSTKYTHSQTKLEWQCAYNHQWFMRPTDVRCGQWCPTCARNKQKKHSRKPKLPLLH